MRRVLLICAVLLLAANAHAQFFRVVTDYTDSVVVLHESKEVLRFHIVPNEQRPFTIDLGILPPYVQVSSRAAGQFAVVAVADSIATYRGYIGGLFKYDGDDFPGAEHIVSAPYYFRVISDTCLRLEPFINSVSLLPDYSVGAWSGTTDVRVINGTADTAVIDSFYLTGAVVDSMSHRFSVDGRQFSRTVLAPFSTLVVAVALAGSIGFPYGERRDTLTLSARAIVRGADTILSGATHLSWIQPSRPTEAVIGPSTHVIFAKRNEEVIDSFDVKRFRSCVLWNLLGNADCIKVKETRELDTVTRARIALKSPNRSLLCAKIGLVFKNTVFFDTTRFDTVWLHENFSTVDTETISWRSAILPTRAKPTEATLGVDGSIMLPFANDSLAWCEDSALRWNVVRGPKSNLSFPVRLKDSTLLVRAADSVLYVLHTDDTAWQQMTDTLNLFRNDVASPLWRTDVRVDRIQEVAGDSLVVLMNNWQQDWAYGGEQQWYLLGSTDARFWSHWQYSAPDAAVSVDSDGSFSGFTQIGSSIRNDTGTSYHALSTEKWLPNVVVGCDGGGVLRAHGQEENCANFMLGRISHLALTAMGEFFASDDTSLWHYDALGDIWQVLLPRANERIRRLFFDFHQHLIVVTDLMLYRSQAVFASVVRKSPSAVSLEVDSWDAGAITVHTSGVGREATLMLLNEMGRVLARARCLSEGETLLPTPNLPHGQYFLAVQSSLGNRLVGIVH